MIYGIIYKHTNKINNKIYIGQTIRPLKIRHKRHLKDSKYDNLYFHRALKKHREENFSLEIIEDNIEKDKLDEREIYWIKYYDSFYLNGKGYNMTEGGKWGNAPRKLSNTDINEVQSLLINTDIPLVDIGDEYNVSLSCISDINVGRTWKNENYTYPLREGSKKRNIISKELFKNIVLMLKETNLTYKEIAKKLNTFEYTIGNINRGTHSMCKESNYDFPIRKIITKGAHNTKLTEEEVIKIIYEIIFTDKSYNELTDKFNISKNTIGDISSGKTWKYITNQFIIPIRKNKKKNKNVYKEIYGIVYSPK